MIMKCLQNVSVFGVHAEKGYFQNESLSNLSIFIGVSKSFVFTPEQCERKAKTDKFCSVFGRKRCSVNGA